MTSNRTWARALALAVTATTAWLGMSAAPAAAEDGMFAVTGSVTSSSGDPLEDIEVYAYGPMTGDYGYGYTEGGAFSFEVPSGTYDLYVTDYSNAYQDRVLEDGLTVVDAAVPLSPIILSAYSTISGTVAGPDAESPTSLMVVASDAETGRSYTTYTDAGAFSFPKVEDGTYEITVSDPYYETWATVTAPDPVVVEDGDAATVGPLALTKRPRGTLDGVVTGDDDLPIEGILVIATNDESGVQHSDYTGSAGAFELPDILAGDYTVTFQDPSDTWQSLTLPDPVEVLADQETDLEVQLQHVPRGSVVGRLSDGVETPGSFVNLTATDTETGQQFFGTTAVDGGFLLRLPPGEYTLRGDDTQDVFYPYEMPGTFAVVDQQQTDLDELTLTKRPKGTIAGVVQGTEGPVVGAPVELYRLDPDYGPVLTRTVETDGEGAYAFEGVTGDRQYTVSVKAPGYALQVLGGGTDPAEGDVLTITDGETTEVPDLVLAPVPVVSGTLLTEGGTGTPVIGALVFVEYADGTTLTTYTDAEGDFSLELSEGSGLVQVDYADSNTAFGGFALNGGQPITQTGPVQLGTVQVEPWGVLDHEELAATLDLDPTTVVSTTYNSDVLAAQRGSESVGGFPRAGSDYLMMSTGKLRRLRGSPSTFYSSSLGGPSGIDGNDLSQVELELDPPAGASCLAFDFVYQSEEFPEYVGSGYNDVFSADLNGTGWSQDGSQLLAPNNFAYDEQGRAVSINTTGFAAVPGLVMDGSTPLLRAATPVETDLDTGHMTVTLSNQDLGDSGYDSVVLVDNMQWVYNVDNCARGAEALTDTDEDGMSDVWETEGIDYDGDGTPELDLPALGADPEHKDIFLEIDWMEKPATCTWYICYDGRSFAPQPEAVADVVTAFANAPVANPDGTTGINLHVDAGPGYPRIGGGTWGAGSQAGVVPWTQSLGTIQDGSYDWTAFDTLREDNFAASRRDVFHYVVYADTYAGSGSSGISRGIPGQDLLVTDGHSSWGSGFTRTQERGTLMHELGHNLSLYHGGGPGGPWHKSAEYLSIMNYRYQLTGITPGSVLDYSRSSATYHDWFNIRFDGGSVGDLGDTVPPPEESTSDSLTPSEAKDDDAFAKDGDGTLAYVGPTVLLPDSGSRMLLFDVVNPGSVDVEYTVSTTSEAFANESSATATVPAGTTARFEVPVDTTGLELGEHTVQAVLATDDVAELATTSGSFTAPDMSDPDEQEAAAAAVEELQDSDIDPELLEQVEDMVEEGGEPQPVENTALPTVVGEAEVGKQVTATSGSWNPTPEAVTYQWLLDGEEIAGADGAAYTPVAGDLGGDLSVEVTASATGSLPGLAESEPVVVGLGDAPQATTAPSFAGTAQVGEDLTAGDGTWDLPGVSLTREWLRDGQAIPGAAGTTYTLVPADAGHQVSLRVTASRAGHATGQALSGSALVVAGDQPTPTTLPSISGTPKAGSALTADPGTWSMDGLDFGFQWLRDGEEVVGEDGVTYAVTKADQGTELSVRVVASTPGYADGQATSAAVAVPVPKVASTTKATVVKAGTTKRGAKIKVVVKAGKIAPTGTVLVKEGKKKIVSFALKAKDKGVRVLSLPKLKKGKHVLSLVYSGDKRVKASKTKLTVVIKSP